MSTQSHTGSLPVIMELLNDLWTHLGEQNAAAIKRTAAQLQQTAQGSVVMKILAPILFQGDASNTDNESNETSKDNRSSLSSLEALSVMGFLVQSNPSNYLRPASEAIRNEAVRLTTSPEPMLVSESLLKAMIDQISSSDVQVASNATDAIVACSRKLGVSFAEPALVALATTWQNSLQALPEQKAIASTRAIRCATAVIDLVASDEAVMKIALDRDVLHLILDMLMDEQDPLLQMSVLDLLEKMAHTQPLHDTLAIWCFSSPVTSPLLQLAGGAPHEEPHPLLGGPALRVVAALCKLSQLDASSHAAVGQFLDSSLLSGFHCALHNFEGSGEVDRLALIDAISSFAAASPDALALVLNDPVTREGWLALNVPQSKLKAAILVSVAHVIYPPSRHWQQSTSHSPEVHSAAHLLNLYSFVGRTNNQESTSMLLQMTKSPLPEIRLGVYTLLEAVARLPSGGQLLLSTGNFIDFLLSREADNTKEGREARFAIVKAIHESPVMSLLSDEISRKIAKHIAQGPHHVKAIPWELAI